MTLGERWLKGFRRLFVHKHKCHRCGTVWEHSFACAGKTKPHTCPTCGYEQRARYYGDDPIGRPKGSEYVFYTH